MSDSGATTTTALLNLGTVLGRPIVGLASDHYRRVKVAGLSTFFCSLLVFSLWVPARSSSLLYTFALLGGSVLGLFWMVHRSA